MLYTSSGSSAVKKEWTNQGQHITSVEDVARKTSDYTLINFQSTYVDNTLEKDFYSQEVQECLNPVGILSKMYASKYYTNSGFMSYYNIKEADVMQCMGNINFNQVNKFKIQRQVVDVSVCTTETYNSILDGTFKGHTGEFLDNMKQSIEENNAIYEYNKAVHDSKNTPNIENEETNISLDNIRKLIKMHKNIERGN